MRGLEAGLGWFISSDHGDEIAWKDGSTGGFLTFIGFSTTSRQGSIVLSNAFAPYARDLGAHLGSIRISVCLGYEPC
jgi:hypothetical protein